jgi:hypothetical protein
MLCDIYIDEFPAEDIRVMEACCGDKDYRICLQRLFELSFTDESLFPPKCCGIFIVPDPNFFDVDINQKFRDEMVEFGTPAAKRVYCSSVNCGMFIEPVHVAGNKAEFPTCEGETCVICKQAMHSGTDCPQDIGIQQLLVLGK